MKRKKSRALKATDLARSIWRLEGRCEFCGKTSDQVQLQGAHVFGVGAYPRLRDDLRNGLCLCAYHHRYFTSSPVDFVEWIETTKYAKYLPNLRKKQMGPKIKVFWDERLEELRDIKKSIEAGELTLDEVRDSEDYL